MKTLLSRILADTKDLSNREFISRSFMLIYNRQGSAGEIQHQSALLESQQTTRPQIIINFANARFLHGEEIDILSIHIPKTAGSNLLTCLKGEYSGEYIKLVYNDHRDVLTIESPKPVVIHGHIEGAKYIKSHPNAKKVVWLRNPINRLISEHAFWISNYTPGTAPRGREPYDIVTQNNLSFEEYMDPQLIPSEYSPHNTISDRWLKDCDLDSFDFIGITERFEEDIIKMSKILGWKSSPTPSQDIGGVNASKLANYNSHVRAIMSNKPLIRKLEKLNMQDIDLYNKYQSRSNV